MAQLEYCQKLDFEGYLNNNLKYPNKKNSLFRKLNIFRYYLILIYFYINREPVVQYPNNKSVGLRGFYY